MRRASVGPVPQADEKEEPRRRQFSDGERQYDREDVDRAERQVGGASERGTQGFRNLVETQRHAARFEPEPSFDE